MKIIMKCPELTDMVGNRKFNYQNYLKHLISMDVTVYTKFFKRRKLSQISDL